MTVKNILADQIIARIGRESTYGTTATNMKRIALSGRQQPLGQQAVEMLQSEDLGLYRHDANAPVRGLGFGADVGCQFLLRSEECSRLLKQSVASAPGRVLAARGVLQLDILGRTAVATSLLVIVSPGVDIVGPFVLGCEVEHVAHDVSSRSRFAHFTPPPFSARTASGMSPREAERARCAARKRNRALAPPDSSSSTIGPV